MADEGENARVTLEELMVSTLAVTDAFAKLLIGKDIITDDGFKTQLRAGELSCRVAADGLEVHTPSSTIPSKACFASTMVLLDLCKRLNEKKEIEVSVIVLDCWIASPNPGLP